MQASLTLYTNGALSLTFVFSIQKVLPPAPSTNSNDNKVGPDGGLGSLSILAEASFAADDAASQVVEAATRRHNTRKRHSGSDRIGGRANDGEFSRPTQPPERPRNHPRGGSFGGSLNGHGGSGDNGTLDASSMSYGDLTHLLGSNSMAWPVSQISAFSALENPHLPNGFLLQPPKNLGGGNGAVGATSSYFAGIGGHPQHQQQQHMQYRMQPQPPQEEKLSTLAATNLPPAVAAAMVGLESECRSLRAEQSALKHQLVSVLQTQAETVQRLDHFLGLVSRAYGPAGGTEPRGGVGVAPPSGGGVGMPHEALLVATAAAALVTHPDLLACARLNGGAASERSESEDDEDGSSDDGEEGRDEENGNGRSRSGKRQRVGANQSDDEDENSDREGSDVSADEKSKDGGRGAEEAGFSSAHNSGDEGYDDIDRRDRDGEAANENATFSPIAAPRVTMPPSNYYFGQAWSSP